MFNLRSDLSANTRDGGKKIPIPVKPTLPGVGAPVPKPDAKLIFEAVKWGYEVISDSSKVETKDNEATALIKGTEWIHDLMQQPLSIMAPPWVDFRVSVQPAQ